MRRIGTVLRLWTDRRNSVLELAQQTPVVDPAVEPPKGDELEPAPAPVNVAAEIRARYLSRLVQARLDELEGGEVRRAAWVPEVETGLGVHLFFPLVILISLLLIAAVVWGARRGSQQRRPRRELRF